MHKMETIKTIEGKPVLSYDEIEKLREKPSDLRIIAQKGCQEKFLATNADITIFGGNRGPGKLQPYTAKICTPFGFREMGDLKIGSIISNPVTGGMERVIQIFEHGEKDIYRLFFSDGGTTECGLEHLWLIKKTNHISKTRWINGTGKEADWRVWDFQMIKDFLDKQKGKPHSQWKQNLLIPVCAPVKFTKSGQCSNQKKNRIDPYLIGALLGDGCMSDTVMNNNYVSLTSADKEIAMHFIYNGFVPRVSKDKRSLASEYVFKDKPLIDAIKKLGLKGRKSDTKFIPACYKLGTVDERLAIVQGLMDTDGTTCSKGHLSFTTVSKQLAEDMQFVLRSLGAVVTMTKGKAGYKKEGEYIPCKDSYDLYIKAKDTSMFFRLERKKANCRPFNGGVSDVCRRIVGYEYVGKKKCRCITVDDPHSLYITDDFIVTHNTFSLLMEALKDITNKRFNAVVLRAEKGDFKGIIEKSNRLFSQFGTYNRSQNDMTWNFNNGGKLYLTYFSDPIEDFKKRFQGQEYSYIGIDEITHIPFEKFRYILTDNRNSAGIRNRFYGTCNPDPDSWVRKFIDWWIGEDGIPIEERDGVVRYCFMEGSTPDTIYWGDTPEEVYLQCKGIIDKAWKPELEKYGFSKITSSVKSVTFIKGKLEENIALITSDPNYIANLIQQDEEQRARDLEGNWNFKAAGDDLIKMEDMEAFFNNSFQTGDGIRRASCDVAFDGGDNLTMFLWVGKHMEDVFVCRANGKETPQLVKMKLREWGVLEKNFVYDLNGIGQVFKGFFPDAIGFNNMGAPIASMPAEKDAIRHMYSSLKSQCAYMLVQDFKNRRMSVNPQLLDMKFSGNGYEDVPLKQILMKERKAIRDAASEKGFTIIKKETMKKYVGHSPDFIEGMLYMEAFSIKPVKGKPKFTIRYINRR